MKFDDMLTILGEFGRYQLMVYFVVSCSTVFTVFHKMAWVFIGAVPDFRCFLPFDATSNNSMYKIPEQVLNASLPWDESNSKWSTCYKFAENYSSIGKHTEKCEKWIYDTSVYTYTVITEFDLVCDRSLMGTLLLTLSFIGECFGSIFISIISDKFGRKKSLILCLVSQGIVGLVSAFIQNYYVYAVSRVLLGAFTQGIFLVSFVLAMEFIGTSKRVVAGTAFNYFFALGYLIEAGIAYSIRDWRYLQLAISIPPLLYSVVIVWVPESARWLIAMDKTEHAIKIMEKMAKINKKKLPDNYLKVDKEISEDMKLIDVIKIPSIFIKILIMCYVWFAIDAVYFGLSLNTSNLGGNDLLNFLIAALLEFPGYTVSIFFTYYCGRRYPLFISLAVSGLALIGNIFVPVEMHTVIIILAMTGKFGSTVAFSIIYVYAIELYPTQIRNGALGLNSTCARIGGIVSSLIMLLRGVWLPFPWLVLGFISVTSGILILLLPETNKNSLPENFTEASNILKKNKKNTTE